MAAKDCAEPFKATSEVPCTRTPCDALAYFHRLGYPLRDTLLPDLSTTCCEITLTSQQETQTKIWGKGETTGTSFWKNNLAPFPSLEIPPLPTVAGGRVSYTHGTGFTPAIPREASKEGDPPPCQQRGWVEATQVLTATPTPPAPAEHGTGMDNTGDSLDLPVDLDEDGLRMAGIKATATHLPTHFHAARSRLSPAAAPAERARWDKQRPHAPGSWWLF